MTVTDFYNHERPVRDAVVELVQLSAISGVAFTIQDTKHTDYQGVAVFTLQQNGNYSLRITADGYMASDEMLFLNCSQFHCSACTPALKPQLKETFCSGKQLTVVVVDAVSSQGVVGGLVAMWVEVNTQRDGQATAFTDAAGLAKLPLKTNGKHNLEISVAGYITMNQEVGIQVPPGSCSTFQPVLLSPLSPELPSSCEAGARISLTWADQADLDLYSWRVGAHTTEDTCLTYFCDGKDPCSGITHDIDNKIGGFNGSETITYCKNHEFVHMIYVDDSLGDGSSFTFPASLFIQAPHQAEVIHVNSTRATSSRYNQNRFWLVGCLLLKNEGFHFIEINKFLVEPPYLQHPDYCYNEVHLGLLAQEARSAPSGQVRLYVHNTPVVLSTTIVELRSSTGLSHYKAATADGLTVFSNVPPGKFSLTVRSSGHHPAVVNRTLNCNTGNPNCKLKVNIQLVRVEPDSSLRLDLRWDSACDLDLHAVQVDGDWPAVDCDTYYNQPSACTGATFQSDARGERIVLADAASRPSVTYMVYVQASLTSATFSWPSTTISVTFGAQAQTHQLPENSQPGQAFWLAGCLQVQGESVVFLRVDQLSRGSPGHTDRLYCHDRLQDHGVPSRPGLCSGATMEVHALDSWSGKPLATNLTVTWQQGERQELLPPPHHLAGQVSVPLVGNGRYHLRAEQAGYVPSHTEVEVACRPSWCRLCAPRVVVPMVRGLLVGEARLVLWGRGQLVLVQRRLDGGVCVGGCPGVRLALRVEEEGIQSAQVSVETSVHYYMVVVDLGDHDDRNYRIEVVENIGLTLTDHRGEQVLLAMKTNKSGMGRFWIAGCWRGNNLSSSSFIEVNAFMDGSPQEKDICSNFLKDTFEN